MTDLSDLLTIARLSLGLGEVERLTRHSDGVKPETDTTHTVMLALSCLVLGVRHGLRADRMVGLALVHDLVEVYAGDTPTARALSPEAEAAKDAREAAALTRLRADFATVPELLRLLEEFTSQRTPEARAVRLLDKCMPKLTHSLNGGAPLRDIGLDVEELRREHRAQVRKYHGINPDLPELVRILANACDLAETAQEAP